MSDYFEQKVLGLFNGISYTAPAKIYLTLSSVDPGETGAPQEPAYPGFSRKEMALSVPASMSGGVGVQNTAEIAFAQSDTDETTITHIAVYDSLNGGNMLAYAPLNTEKPIKAGVAPVLRLGEAKFWLTGNFSTAFKTMILNSLRGTNLTAITPYATLFNGNPESGGVELTGGSFARKPVTFGTPVEQPGGQRTISNDVAVQYEVATTNLGTYNTDAIMNAATAGTVLAYSTGTADNYASGDRTIYDAGDLKINVN